jgi:hypothetical protein
MLPTWRLGTWTKVPVLMFVALVPVENAKVLDEPLVPPPVRHCSLANWIVNWLKVWAELLTRVRPKRAWAAVVEAEARARSGSASAPTEATRPRAAELPLPTTN